MKDNNRQREGEGMKQNTLNIKEWADNKFKEHLKTIKEYILDGWTPKDAFHNVMDVSMLGQGYKAQMRRELGLSIFD